MLKCEGLPIDLLYISVGRHRKNICWKHNHPGYFSLISASASVGPGHNTGLQAQLTDNPVEPSLSHPAANLHILHILQASQLL